MITVIQFNRLGCFPGIHGLKSVLRSYSQSGGDVPVLFRRERYYRYLANLKFGCLAGWFREAITALQYVLKRAINPEVARK
jgi:hypothetical protein